MTLSQSQPRNALTLTLSQRERGYKRRAFKLFVFLLAGAIINVAVAWGCGVTASLPYCRPNSVLRAEEASSLWRRYGPIALLDSAPSGYPPTGWRERNTLASTTWFGTSLMSSASGRIEGFAVAPDVTDVLVVESGLPFRSLRSVRQDVVSTMPTSPAPFGRSPPVHHLAWLRSVTPAFPGFAINTIFYAAIAWLLFSAPFAIRKRVRRKRGQCAACGYSLRGTVSAQCPECGAVAEDSNGDS